MRIFRVIELTVAQLKAQFFFQKRYFQKRKKNSENSCEFRKIKKFIRYEKRICRLNIYWKIFFFTIFQ